MQIQSWVQRNKKNVRGIYDIKTLQDLIVYAKANNCLAMLANPGPDFNSNTPGVVLLRNGHILNELNEWEEAYDIEHSTRKDEEFREPQEFKNLVAVLENQAASFSRTVNAEVIACFRECIKAAKGNKKK